VARPIPVAARSKAWVCGRSLAGIVGSDSAGGTDVCLLWVFVLSGRGLRVGLFTRPEESYRQCVCFSKCDREASIMRRPWPTRVSSAMGGGDTHGLRPGRHGRSLFILSLCRGYCWIGSHTRTHTHTFGRSPLEISVCRRDLCLYNTHPSQETNTHVSSEIRTRSPSILATADLRLKAPSHWDRQLADLLGLTN
jgi:hypothetical protein